MLARLSGQLGAVAALHQAAPAAFVAGLQHLGSGRAWLTSSAPASAAASAAPDGDKHVIDEKSDSIVGAYTPITKRLWLQRYRWTDDRLASARERDPAAAATLRKPPQPLSVRYPFSSDPVVREHYRNPWGEARIGRILEDLDSLAGYVGFEHCDDGDPATRPPLLVTASVEAIQLRGSSISLDEDMEMSGRVVWTGSSSMDLRMELVQAGQLQLTALFTFVARDALTGGAFKIYGVQPETEQDKALFAERQATNQALKEARRAAGGAAPPPSPAAASWAQELLAAAKTKRDLPALADPCTLLMDDTMLENTFTCQPEQRNLHGRIFGGFLMSRAFELAHSTAYLFAGRRPHTVEVDQITFKRPVSVGDLIRFKAWVLHAWPSQLTPGKGVAHVQVEASVTQPEKMQSEVTNTFGFRFVYDLRRDERGDALPPKRILPSNEQQALEVAAKFGGGGGSSRAS